MGNIVLLDDLTINKIAAGEVIERPASVVKEMVENSIDAGADKITVEIKNGGIAHIKVTDNGKGIMKDDLEIAFERHATSKIRSANDLDTVTSMGFRGEALASIVSIANVELVSKTKDQETGYKVCLEAGDILQKSEVGCPMGTSITVTNLFFNTPVRYKFLKKDYTESGYIEDVITRIALVNPNISIKLINSGKTVIQTTGNGDLKSVVYSIYGKDVAEAIRDVTYKYENMEITGVIGKPEISRSNRSNQLFFVNKRYIKDKTLSSATAQAYKGLIPIGKFGFVILNIAMNPSKVDVNVHPAKLEVRFEEENKIFQAIYHSIKDTLLKGDLVKNTSKEETKILNKENLLKLTNKREKTFEQRLAEKLEEKEQEKGNKFGGLFGKNRQAKQIEEYNEEESRIKTNNIIEDVYKNKDNQETTEKPINIKEVKIGEALDTSDVLEELRKLQTNIQKEISETKNIETFIKPEENEKTKIDIEKNIEDIENMEITQEDRENIEKKVESFLNNAHKIKEKNSKIIAGEYIPKVDQEKTVIEIANNNEVIEEKSDEKVEEINNEIVEEINNENIEEKENKIDINIININQEAKETEEDEEVEKTDNIIIENKEKEETLEENNTEEKEETLEENNTEEIKEKEEKLEYIKDKINQLEENPNVITDDFKEMYSKLFGTIPRTEKDIEEEQEAKERKQKLSAIDIIKDNVTIFEEEEKYELPIYKFIGIVFRTYIIVEMNSEMYILDQHAAHERIMYEKVKFNYYNEEEKDSQMLLLPDLITLTHREMSIAKENMEMFEKAGFTLEEFGDNTIKLTGCPSAVLDLDTKELFLETLDEINTVARTAKQEKEEKFIATVACKAAVKAHMALDEKEVEALMEELLRLPNPFTCPHGRPTAIKMTKYDIERKFARK